MPRGNGNGPMGEGPMTGRGMGYCAGNSMPGFSYGGGMRMRGRGCGNGRSMGFGVGIRARRSFYQAPQMATQVASQMGAKEQDAYLAQRESLLKEELERVRQARTTIKNDSTEEET